jgi:hypothetical protein
MLCFLRRLFTESCPNCMSAWTGGHPDPWDITSCILCDNPRTGKMRGWVWRWKWLDRINLAKNIRRFEKE